ncbi:MAG: PilZ domain-containing protein [Henriciella sp.]|nr:PilZ domain-containing protein [Hyphomonadaceae bacterium]
MFSSKSKNKVKVDLDRAKSSSSSAPIPVLRPTAENRRGPRKGLWCVCSVFSEAGEVREGIILDVSKTGARIRFRSRGSLPRVVKIKASRIGLNRYARVVWQSTFDAGLEFIPDRGSAKVA